MKYQFQFAGANVSNRRSSPQRKRLRLILLGVALLLAVLAYWQFLHHLIRGPGRTAAPAGVVAAAPSTAATAAAEVPAAQTSPELKQATEAGITALGSYVAKTVGISATPDQPVQAAPVEPVAKTEIAAVPVPVARIVSEPPTPRRPHTRAPEDRLMLAGRAAFATCMEQAKKYPDSYGFGAEDRYSSATLGDPIPVYTIEDADRAKYKPGQPVKPLLKPMNLWVFPVISNGRVCCMVQVKYTGRDYVPQNGSRTLGMAWNKIQERWPASEGYHPCLVVYQNVSGYYFTIPELPEQNMTDIVKLFYYSPNLSPADVILASWR